MNALSLSDADELVLEVVFKLGLTSGGEGDEGGGGSSAGFEGIGAETAGASDDAGGDDERNESLGDAGVDDVCPVEFIDMRR